MNFTVELENQLGRGATREFEVLISGVTAEAQPRGAGLLISGSTNWRLGKQPAGEHDPHRRLVIAMMRSGKSRVVKQVYVVDIWGPSGGRVAKEYEARSLLSAVRRAERELRAFPECQVNRHTVETGLGHMCRS